MKTLRKLWTIIKFPGWLATAAVILLLWGLATAFCDAGDHLEAWLFRRKREQA